MALQHPSHHRILCLDGGGFRGLVSLLVLERIMKEAATRAGQPTVLPCEAFDIICGSSTGGLVALLIGRLGLDCRTAIDVYKSLSRSLLGDSEESFWDTVFNSSTFNEKRYEDELEALIAKYGKDGTQTRLYDDTAQTKTFIICVADTPDDRGLVNIARSYPAPPQASYPIPLGHNWSIFEAARATCAQPVFMSPLLLQNGDRTFEFRDAAACGFNNPTQIGLLEVQRLWKTEDIGTVVSIGSGLLELHPMQPGRSWVPLEQHVKRFSMPIVSKRFRRGDEDIAQARVYSLIKSLISVAADSEIIHNTMVSNSSFTYHRLNLPLPFLEIDLVDCFITEKVEREIKLWLDDPVQIALIKDVVAALVHPKPKAVTVEQARLLEPPKPPANTNPGYNPQLDKARPQVLIDYLRSYQVIFVIDDSGSMMNEGRWEETQEALTGISAYARQYGSDIMEVMFFNSPVRHVDGKDVMTVAQLFLQVQPDGSTPTGAALKRVLDAQIRRLDAAIDTPAYSDIKPLDIIVITDGKPTDSPQDVLVEAAAHLKAMHHHPNCIGIQFVQIGNESRAEASLRKLIECENGNMIDTVPYTSKLDAKKLERILLGALHPNVRGMMSQKP